MHDSAISLHENARLILVIEKIQIGLAYEELGRLPDQLCSAPIRYEHSAFKILGVDHAGNRCGEYAQQFIEPVSLDLGNTSAVDIEEYARLRTGSPLMSRSIRPLASTQR